jgi:hypothetical protein
MASRDDRPGFSWMGVAVAVVLGLMLVAMLRWVVVLVTSLATLALVVVAALVVGAAVLNAKSRR